MGVTLLIRASSESLFQNGQAAWSGKWLDEITTLFPDFTSLSAESIDGAIGIYAKKEKSECPAKKLVVTSFRKTAAGVLVGFSTETEMAISSGELRKRAWIELKKAGLIEEGGLLPFCCVLSAQQIDAMLNSPSVVRGGSQATLLEELKQMQQRNDWRGIYDRFVPVEVIAQNQPTLWNDAEILGIIGFACGKLAETSGIPQEIFQDEKRKRAFLQQQAQYRRETEMLRKRCVELTPNVAGYWSTLAYLYYQNVQELSQPKGRRDGNIREEIDKALEHLDKALSLDANRIVDHYRKGYLLARIVPRQVLFGPQDSDTGNRSEIARQKRLQGIVSLLQAVRIWESLAPQDERQNEKRKRYHKEYVKSLYDSGRAYYEMIVNDWDEAIYALGLREGISESDNVTYNPKDLENADNAWRYFHACCVADRQGATDLKEANEPQADITIPVSGVIEGVRKSYWLGKVSFARYWILSGNGQKDTPRAIEHRDKAKQYLVAALRFPWSPSNQRMKKDFIAELLARLYISSGEYAKAVEVLEKHRSGRFLDPFVAHTLALALILLGRNTEAQNVLEGASRDRNNKDIWTTYFLSGCSYLSEGRLDKAHRSFETANAEARKQGKETIDTLLIGQAFVSYKSNNRPEAVAYLKQAIEMNPYRISVGRRLANWQKENN
ncbi:MAG: hypothetical protein IT330_10690 [Anaerolineae bacterium]|nr:hypothetical protein [Anaerolineae bacterium]